MAGVTSGGFVTRTLDEIKEGLRAGWRTALGASVNVAETSRNGQMISNIAAALSDVWELGEELASVFSQPSGIFLDFIASLTNTFRNPATYSTVTLYLTGTNGTLIAAGKEADTVGTSARWLTTSPATLATATAWATATAYTVGQVRRTSGGCYYCIQAGTSAGAGSGPTSTGQDITDGTAHWRWLGAGAAYATAPAQATETGPIQGYASTITTIATAVSGWQGVNNVADATVGADEESDSSLRARRSLEVAATGSSPLDDIRASVARVSGVTSVGVTENVTDATVSSIPPHCFEVLVEGGTDADVAQAILDAKAAGIGTYGTTTQSATDDAGVAHDVKFSRPSSVDIWVSIALQKGPGYPADGDAQVAAAIVAAGDALGLGYDVWASACQAQAFTVAGVLNVTSCLVGTSDPPGASSVSISPRQVPSFDTGRVAVTSSTITP